MTHETFNLLLATVGLVVVVGGVAATQLVLVIRQAPRIAAEITATEPQESQKRPAPASTPRPDRDRVPA